MAFLPQNLIRKKRDGQPLSSQELEGFLAGVTDASIPDYQVSAMLMAIYFRGLSDEELSVWTQGMLHSGTVLDLSAVSRPKVDKHSTGGVGDKISLPLAPAVAAAGIAVPMVSGRGLGHTGGTLDKLEAIPGFNVNLSLERFRDLVDSLGLCLIGQTAEIAPADKKLYALRDVTGTVESIPLIASSIMSKKLAEGIDALVLDCKVGNGAFMETIGDARRLAQAILAIGRAAEVPVSALITDMNAPIGKMIGNSLEVMESIEVLQGRGPDDTRELTIELGSEMLRLGGAVDSSEAGRARVAQALDTGEAAALFARLVEAQGGDPRVVEDPEDVLPRAAHKLAIPAPRSGIVESMNTRDLGVASLWLGAGRSRAEDSIDPAVGIELCCAVGDSVDEGEPLAFLHHNDRNLSQATYLTREAILIADEAVSPPSRILEVLRS